MSQDWLEKIRMEFRIRYSINCEDLLKITVQDQMTAEIEPDYGGDSPQRNVFRRHIKEDPYKIKCENISSGWKAYSTSTRCHMWDTTLVCTSDYNQTKYSDEVYLEKHKSQFREDITCCPLWELEDFYVDQGFVALGMEYSKEWCVCWMTAFQERPTNRHTEGQQRKQRSGWDRLCCKILCQSETASCHLFYLRGHLCAWIILLGGHEGRGRSVWVEEPSSWWFRFVAAFHLHTVFGWK